MHVQVCVCCFGGADWCMLLLLPAYVCMFTAFRDTSLVVKLGE